MSLLHRRKSTSLLSYLGSKLASICTVLVGSPASICMALASSIALKALDVGGMAGLSDAKGTQRLSSLNLTMATTEAARSMLP
jgi:ethanolamine utilization microcompartment shell protein EutL